MSQPHQPRVMVIRTADEEKAWIFKELRAGRLRQGWGLEGSQVAEDGVTIPAELWVERYTSTVRKHWDEKASARDSAKRSRIISVMLNLQEGDLVVVPKMPAPGEFAIVRVAGRPVPQSGFADTPSLPDRENFMETSIDDAGRLP